jgi:hypothetical protein
MGLALLAACSQGSGTVVGPVVAVDGDLTEVHSFTVLVSGEEMTFASIPDGSYAFPLPHLREHLVDGTPVRVGWEEREGRLVAVSLDDG